MDNILDSDCEALVNPVNCVGVMGAGLALQFRQKYPKMFAAYSIACGHEEVEIGKVWPWDDPMTGQRIVNFPTKGHWRASSKWDWVDRGLEDLRRFIQRECIQSVAIPPLGCGLGGLDWNLVEPSITYHLHDLEIRVDIYPPNGERYTL